MSELVLFENEEFGRLRVTDNSGDPWFIAKDIAVALGYMDTGKAVRTYCKHITKFSPSDSSTVYNIIPESDVYRLVLKSELPSAEKFQDWVVEVVLPSIRKTGEYSCEQLHTLNMEKIYTEFIKEMEEYDYVPDPTELSKTLLKNKSEENGIK